ncbi:MAG: putative 2-dehydropantoate 2-reductase [Thermodesulfobacteriota bacterium]
MKIGIIGTGAVGGYYGALLVHHGFEVHFLLHSDFDAVRRYGLYVESKNGDMHLPTVNAYGDPADMPPCDIVIIALKTTENDHLKTILPEVVKADGIVLTLQNGFGVEKDLSRIVPGATVMGGLCFLCSNKVGPGHIKHLDYGSIRLGQYSRDETSAGITSALKDTADILGRASIAVHMTDNLGKARWEKLVWNIPFNGLSVVLNANTQDLISSSPARSLVHEIMLEVLRGARACGYDIADEFADKMLTATQKMVAYSPSMRLDYDAGRALEINKIYRRPVNAAKSAGLKMKRARMLIYQLEYLDPARQGAA